MPPASSPAKRRRMGWPPALVLALSTGLREGLLDTTDYYQRRPGIWAVAYAVMIAPMVFVHHYLHRSPSCRRVRGLLAVRVHRARLLHPRQHHGDFGVSRRRRRGGGRRAPASRHPAARRAPRHVGLLAISVDAACGAKTSA